MGRVAVYTAQITAYQPYESVGDSCVGGFALKAGKDFADEEVVGCSIGHDEFDMPEKRSRRKGWRKEMSRSR